jgi:hypothetical protein
MAVLDARWPTLPLPISDSASLQRHPSLVLLSAFGTEIKQALFARIHSHKKNYIMAYMLHPI